MTNPLVGPSVERIRKALAMRDAGYAVTSEIGGVPVLVVVDVRDIEVLLMDYDARDRERAEFDWGMLARLRRIGQ